MTVTEGGPALFQLVRFWSRRWARGVAVRVGEPASLPQHVLTVEAVSAAGEPTVGEVAHRLGLDHSGASRMVAAATASGYLTRSRSSADARRTVLRLTAEGHALLHAAHQWQQAAFAELTAAWPAADRERFAGYLVRLADEVTS